MVKKIFLGNTSLFPYVPFSLQLGLSPLQDLSGDEVAGDCLGAFYLVVFEKKKKPDICCLKRKILEIVLDYSQRFTKILRFCTKQYFFCLIFCTLNCKPVHALLHLQTWCHSYECVFFCNFV